jgi:hypothetical protein
VSLAEFAKIRLCMVYAVIPIRRVTPMCWYRRERNQTTSTFTGNVVARNLRSLIQQ